VNNKFIQFLLDNGYKEYPSYIDTIKIKLFCKQSSSKIKCNCNLKHVQICVKYTIFEQLEEFVEVCITAQNKEGFWFNLKVYTIKPEEFMIKYLKIEQSLAKAWEAINE